MGVYPKGTQVMKYHVLIKFLFIYFTVCVRLQYRSGSENVPELNED